MSAYRPGRGSQLTGQERREIQELALVEGLGPVEIGRRTGRDRSTVSAVLRSEDTAKLKSLLEADQTDEARRRLQRAVAGAARNWERAVEAAADRGDHRPARDLLLHTRVIEPVKDERYTAVGVQVLIGTPECPIPYDPLAKLGLPPSNAIAAEGENDDT